MYLLVIPPLYICTDKLNYFSTQQFQNRKYIKLCWENCRDLFVFSFVNSSKVAVQSPENVKLPKKCGTACAIKKHQ